MIKPLLPNPSVPFDRREKLYALALQMRVELRLGAFPVGAEFAATRLHHALQRYIAIYEVTDLAPEVPHGNAAEK